MFERIKRIVATLSILTLVSIWCAFIITAQNRNTSSPFAVFRVSTATDTATLTASQVSPGLLIGTPTAGATYTTPTAAALCSFWPGIALLAPGTNTNYGYEVWVRNTSGGANTITFAAGNGVTLATGNTNTVAQNHTRIFKFVPTSCAAGNNPSGVNTWTIYTGPDSAH